MGLFDGLVGSVLREVLGGSGGDGKVGKVILGGPISTPDVFDSSKTDQSIKEAKRNFRKARSLAVEGEKEIKDATNLFMKEKADIDAQILSLNKQREVLFNEILLPIHQALKNPNLVLPVLNFEHKIKIPSMPDVDVSNSSIDTAELLRFFGFGAGILARWEASDALEESYEALKQANDYRNKAMERSAQMKIALGELAAYKATCQIYERYLKSWSEIWNDAIIRQKSNQQLMTLFILVAEAVNNFPLPGSCDLTIYSISVSELIES